VVAEMLLYAAGFDEAAKLGRKVVGVNRLCSEVLPAMVCGMLVIVFYRKRMIRCV
jgi:hypothetical protein